MFEKLKISGILAKFPKSGGSERKAMLEKLAALGDMAVGMTADELRYNHILYTDAEEIFMKIFRKEYLPVFIQGLSDHKENVRELYADTITKRGGAAAVSALIEKMADDDNTLRKAAGELVVSLGGMSAVARISPLLRHENKEVKKTAMDALVAIKPERAVEMLSPLLDDRDQWIRRKTVEAICKLKDKQSIPLLKVKLADEKDSGIIKMIIEAIGSAGGKEDAVFLLPTVKNMDLTIRQLATEAISRIADSTLVPHLLDLLKDEDVNIRRSAVDILDGLKDPSTAAALIRALKDGDWWVREIATDALSALGGGKISQMISGLLHDEDEYVRRSAVEFYCRVKDPSVYAALVQLLADKDWWVREKAITALGLIGSPDAIPEIAKMTGDSEVKWAIPRALKSIGSPEGLKPLGVLLKDDQRQIRFEALEAVLSLDGPESDKLVKTAALDKDAEIAGRALKALRERTGRTWLKEDVMREAGPANGGKQAPLITFMEVSPGDLLTEAIMVVDICQSTGTAATFGDNFILKMGDDLFETIIPIARDEGVRFYKSTGDGYLMTFESALSAVNTAVKTLARVRERNAGSEGRRRMSLRFSINFGECRVDNNLDRIGVAVNMTFRADGIKQDSVIIMPGQNLDQINNFPAENRILLTEPALMELSHKGDFQARPLGFFELRGITGLHKLYQLLIEGE
ncbi:MAG: HEAT repeat domain-containing protein [Nitrospinae bacterium]|nr:HEAT repeat domain-containing protein [Nitrospinota bacterium]